MNLSSKLYQRLPQDHCSTVVSCLAQMAAIRRSLFTNNERTEYFHNLLAGVKTMLENINHLSDSKTYHEFCKLLARLRAIYQLSEFVKAPCWADFIRLLTQFTVDSLREVECPANSLHYVLSMWHKLVASVPYMRSSEPHYLEKYAPEVTLVYITTRLNQVPHLLRDEALTNALNDQTILQQQLEQIAIVARCTYKKVAEFIMALYTQTISEFERVLSTVNDVETLRVKQFQLCWLVYIIGAIVGARMSSSQTDDSDVPDAQLICQVLMLVRALNSQAVDKTLDHLEIAIIAFFDQFRRIYIGEQMQKTSTVYITLADVLGLKDESMLLELIVNKILRNLKEWSSNNVILAQTLQLLSDLSMTYSGLRKLSKLEPVQTLLRHHSSETLPFLSLDSRGLSEEHFRHRTTFYTSLTRLLLVDLSDEDDRFDDFLQPITVALDSLAQHFVNGAALSNDFSRRVFIGLCRDIRGIVFALNTKTYFLMFFEWFYPRYTPMFHKAMEIWFSDPRVTTPVLKLYCELVQNRFQRLLFETSPLGVLLFRECSSLMVKYGERILSTNVPKDKEYPLKLKGVCCCFQILKNALSGNFLNFAIFHLYQDKALEDSLKMFVQLLLSMSGSHFLQYPKLSLNYYNLLEVLSGDHIHFVANLEIGVLAFIIQTVAEGLVSVDATISTSCCCTLDQILTFLYKKVSKQKKNRPSLEPPVSEEFLRITHNHAEIFDRMLYTMMTTVIYDELRNQWSLSRPLIGLILLRVNSFEQFRIEQIRSQTEEKRANGVSNAFASLMDGIERNLTNKNKDKFTQNVAVFRRDIVEALRSNKDMPNAVAANSVSQSGDDMF